MYVHVLRVCSVMVFSKEFQECAAEPEKEPLEEINHFAQ